MSAPRFNSLPSVTLCVIAIVSAINVSASSSADQEPINYSSNEVNDPVARLERRLGKGEVTLSHDDKNGYLASLLKYLEIPVSSQTLVYSKTSFQRQHIWPDSPRALYFNDHTYVGWVKAGDVVEIASMDPQKGAIFYTLSQKNGEKPVFKRQLDSCLQCHDSGMTENMPGLLVRSVFPDTDGMPIYNAGTFRINHESPIKERWGGWYVSGKHGDQLHMGNKVFKNKDNPELEDMAKGSNVTDLSTLVDTKAYLTSSSDIVALMVLEHQARAHNLITQANHLTRIALRDESVINKALNRMLDGHSDSTLSRIKSACEPLLKYMLFIDEARLTAPIEGSNDYAKTFQALDPRDKQGRSLRDFELKTRMFRYPCSYLIYSEGFDALPAALKAHFWKRLYDVLDENNTEPAFSKLTIADKRAILEIIRDTKADLPPYWSLVKN